MGNGGSGPIPSLPTAVWNSIKSLSLTQDGGWQISRETNFLVMIRSDAGGGTEWALYTAAQLPSCCFTAPMSSSDWDEIKNGTLDTGENAITSGGSDYRIEFCNSGGATAKVIPAS